jgi:hypothetical protein
MSSLIVTSQPGMGSPTLPARRAPIGLAEMIEADSVQPYPSYTVALGTRRSNSSLVSAASGAAPEVTAARSDRLACSSGRASSIWIIDGTRVVICTRCCWARSSQPAGSNQRISTVWPGSVSCMPMQVTSRP